MSHACGSSAAVLSSLSPAWTMAIAATTAASSRIRADYRYADDVQINREMREVERWNDPASEFLTVSTSLTHHSTSGRPFSDVMEKLICVEKEEEQRT